MKISTLMITIFYKVTIMFEIHGLNGSIAMMTLQMMIIII